MIVIPAHLWPRTALELYRIVSAIPKGVPARVVAIADGVVVYVRGDR